MPEHPAHEHAAEEQPRADVAETVRCSFCDQPVSRTETTHLQVGAAHSDPVCVHCASSLFDDVDVEQLTAAEAPSTETDTTAAGDVSWDARRPTRGGITGYLLQYHYLSLSLLWSIHQTNVRLFERFLEEVDVDLLLVVGLVGIVLASSL